MRFWEDIHGGDYVDCGKHVVTAQEIAEFAARYDPQPFHCDEAVARASVYGGVIASGFHTLSLANRMAFESFLRDVASMGSTAVDEVRWLMPVRPGDELSLRLQVVQKQQSRNKPDRGVVMFRYDVSNQRREPVCTMTITELVRRREQA
jgi:acyl dehydratase